MLVIGIWDFLLVVGSWYLGVPPLKVVTNTQITGSLVAMSDTVSVPGLEFINVVLGMLVEDKDQLAIESSHDDLGILITVRVSDRDMGKLIGKSGQTIKSIRTLLRVIGGMANQRVNLKVLEPQQ